MRKSTLLLSVLPFLFLFILSACSDDKCKDQYCLNGGDCLDGSCICPAGYRGAHCEEKITKPGYNCINGNCATYSSLSACQNACATNTGGYNCVNGNCTYVNANGEFATLADCQNACSTITPGYNCVGGNCTYVSNGAQYGTLTECQNACASVPTGQVVFYTHCLFAPDISVTINGETKVIQEGGGSHSTISCGAAGYATFTLPEGSYAYETAGGGYWGTVTITAGQCVKQDVQYSFVPPYCVDKITFWSRGIVGCNSITVNINGISRQITQFHPGGQPQGGAFGTAFFDGLTEGTYDYTASCGSKYWSGQVFIQSLGSSKMIELIEPGYGKVQFYDFEVLCDPDACVNYCGPNAYTVTIANQTKPVLLTIAPNMPFCQGPNDTGSFYLPHGTYQYTVNSGQCCCGSYTGILEVKPDECHLVKLN